MMNIIVLHQQASASSGGGALRLESVPPLKRSRSLVTLGQNQYPSVNVRDRWWAVGPTASVLYKYSTIPARAQYPDL